MKTSILGSSPRFAGIPAIPVGQMTWDVPGTYQWTVPPGVKKMSMLLIGPGGPGWVNGVNAFGGLGGGLTINGVVGTTAPCRGMNIRTTAFIIKSGNFGMAAGGGGSAIPKAQNGGWVNATWKGGHGAARVIWGPDRAYPSTNVRDVV